MTAYRVLVGLSYRPRMGKAEKRAEPGDVVEDLPVKSVAWLLRRGAIEPEPTADEGAAE
jgi:hypothetical protein